MNNLKLAVAAALLCLGHGIAHADQVGPITTFNSNTTAKASEVNANFNAVVSATNNNDSRITTLEGVNASSRLTVLETGATNPNITGNLSLVPSTATAGSILKGGTRFLHDFGLFNTFVGSGAGNFTMTGGLNAAVGSRALQANTTGDDNTAMGVDALAKNTAGGQNTALGASALTSNTTGASNTAVGNFSLVSNTTGNANTATGASALGGNTTGAGNTATGSNALFSNATGNNNTAGGSNALAANTTGSSNTAYGVEALTNSATSDANTAVGMDALRNNTTGANNTALGYFALVANHLGNSNVALGYAALGNNTGDGNIAVGPNAGANLTAGSNNMYLGAFGVTAESNTIRIGQAHTTAFFAGIRGVTTGNADAVTVVVDSNGQLGTLNSSRRVKDDIADMGDASRVLMRLRPVTFHYKGDANPRGRTLQYGLVAEEVAKVSPGLVAHSADGGIETVYYQFLAPMLLNEYQKQQRTIEAQGAEIAELKRRVESLAAALQSR